MATTDAWLKYFEVTKDELDTIFRTVDATLGGEPRTRAELIDAVGDATGRPDLAAKLQSGWGSFLKPSAGRGTLVFGPDRGRNVTFVDPEDWLGKPVRPRRRGQARPERGAGQAGRAVPSSLSRCRPAGHRAMVGQSIHDAEGDRGGGLDLVNIDVEGTAGLALRSDVKDLSATKPFAGVRLLPGFDAYVNDLPRRVEALMPVDRHADVHRVAGWVSPVVIVDGRVAGTWDLASGKRGGITVQPFGRWRGGARKEIAAEADRIAAFLDRPLLVTISSSAARHRVDRRRTVISMLFDAMFLNPDGINPSLILLAIGMTGLIVGFAWIRRAAGPDPDKEPSFWRYRQVDKVRWPSNVKCRCQGGSRPAWRWPWLPASSCSFSLRGFSRVFGWAVA